MVEWFLNAHVLQLCISVVVLILQNTSRYLFCKGLVMVFWKHLTTGDEFEYLALCDDKGQHIMSRDDLNDLNPSSIEVISTSRQQQVDGQEVDDVVRCCVCWPIQSQEATQPRSAQDQPHDVEQPEDIFVAKIAGDVSDVSQHRHTRARMVRTTHSVHIKTALDNTMTQFVRTGYAYMMLSVMLCVPWILLLTQIRTNIQYNPNAGSV